MAVQRTRRARREAKPARAKPQGELTRNQLLVTAERLFAELGPAVSIRQIGEAAGQSNKSAVAYHFGGREALVLAVIRQHAPDIDARRARMLESLAGTDALGPWMASLVKPITDHLEALGTPSWYARFLAHAVSDPSLREQVFEDAIASASMRRAVEEVAAKLPPLPPHIFEARGFMAQYLIVNTCADRERALQTKRRTPHASWQATCDALVDALLGLWRAPVTGS